MKSFPKSEYWHFKISCKHCQENFQFSRRDFFGLQDFDISTRAYLTCCRDSRPGFGRLDFEISLRSYLKSCRDSWRVFGRRDFEISSRSRRESRQVFGHQDFEISPRSHRDLGNLAGQKLAEILAKISVKILQGEACEKSSIFLGPLTSTTNGRHGGLRISSVISGSSGPGSSPGLGYV